MGAAGSESATHRSTTGLAMMRATSPLLAHAKPSATCYSQGAIEGQSSRARWLATLRKRTASAKAPPRTGNTSSIPHLKPCSTEA